MNDRIAKIESLLFALGRPLSRKELAVMLSCTAEEVSQALSQAPEYFAGRGVTLVDDGSQAELRVSAAAAAIVENVRKDEYSRDIGKAGLEVLSAILYRGPLSRSEIDFIRGVNSSQTLRTLTMRGLVRKVSNPKDERRFLYEPTTELLAVLGVARADDLPEHDNIAGRLESLEAAYRAQEEAASS